MIVLRFKLQCRPEKTELVMAALSDVIGPARETDGVISFDVARDIADPNSLIAIEIFEDQGARERQESLPQVGKVMALLPESIAAPPEATIYHVSASEPAIA
ncbi:MAG TPA: antibiotic biosynthesis monooxygenase [Solirubrobacteraceae bacterium]|jgi:quinol monooxygenase YgiN|nr:antibiotic biosynthesis monooxygenase [Solirubrobacteraceae bacterium]